MRNGDLIMDDKGNIRIIVQDNSGSQRTRVAYLFFKSKEDGLNGTISGGSDSHVDSIYKDSILIGNITDIIARAKDEAAS